MAYQLKQYQSTYADPQSIKINELLRQRFAQGFAADDVLGAAVDQMQAADFEGDQALKMELEGRTRNELQERAARGDYETLGMAISRSARAFDRDYIPIQQNYEKVNAYKSEIDAAYKAGDLNAASYRGLMAMSSHDYKGLQRNEDGTIDEGSFFSGYNFVKDVDISTGFDEVMENYAMHKGGSDIQQVGQAPIIGTDPSGNPIYGPPMYQIKKGTKWEEVRAEDVLQLFNDYISSPDVSAYLNQSADLRTYDVTDDEIVEAIGNTLHGDPNDPESKGLYALRDQAIQDGKDEEAKEYEELIAENEALLQGTGTETPEELINNRKQAAKNQAIQSELGREQQTALQKYVRQNVWTEYAEDYDKKWLADYDDFLKNYTTTMSVQTQNIETTGRKDLEDAQNYVALQNDFINQQVEEFNSKIQNIPTLQGTNYSIEEIMSGDVHDAVKPYISTIQNTIKKFQNDIENHQNLIDQAMKETGYVETNTALADSYGERDGEVVFETGQDLLDYFWLTMNETGQWAGMGSPEDFVNMYNEYTGDAPTTAEATVDPNKYTKYQNKLDEMEQMFPGIHDLYNKLTTAVSNDKAKVDEYIKEVGINQVSTFASTTIPGFNEKEIQKNTKVVRDYFINKPLNPTFEIFYNGQIGDGTTNVDSMIEDMGLTGDINVYDVLFKETPDIGSSGIVLMVKDGSGKSVEVHLPADQVRQTGLTEMFNTPNYRLKTHLNQAKNLGLDEKTITLEGGVEMKFLFNDKGPDDVIIKGLTIDGNIMDEFMMSTNDPYFIQAISDGQFNF